MLIDISISAGILILWTILLRAVAKKYLPKRFFVFMWQIVLLRLLIPCNLPFAYNITTPVRRMLQQGRSLMEHSSDAGKILVVREGGQNSFAQSVNRVTAPVQWDVVIWLTVMVVLAVFFGYVYYRESRQLKMAIPLVPSVENTMQAGKVLPKWVRLYVSDRIATPITFGIYRPKIIFPKLFLLSGKEEMKYVLTHEWIHIKYADNLWKIITIAAVCVHWFNPLVWLVYIFINRDMELACDEKVISKWGTEVKEDYAMALIHLAEKQYQRSLFANGFGKNAIQERIVMIMKFKKTTCVSAVCAAILLAGAVTVFSQGNTAFADNAPKKAVTKEKQAKENASAVSDSDVQGEVVVENAYDWIYKMHPEDEKVTYVIDGKKKVAEEDVESQAELAKLAKEGRVKAIVEKVKGDSTVNVETELQENGNVKVSVNEEENAVETEIK